MLIAIEGIDGSGKGTQSGLLVDRLRETGYSAALVSFPRYGKTNCSKLIAKYLNGQLGSLDEVSPYQAAAMFALDRLESKQHLIDLMGRHDIVVADRYVGSNLAYQSARIPANEKARLLNWIWDLEYNVNGLPKPIATVFVDVSPQAAQRHVAKKDPRAYTTASHDLHEQSLDFQGRVQLGYRYLTENGFLGGICLGIPCNSPDGTVATIEQIHESVWAMLNDRVLSSHG